MRVRIRVRADAFHSCVRARLWRRRARRFCETAKSARRRRALRAARAGTRRANGRVDLGQATPRRRCRA
eukprot:1102349-Pleurochrysis_carterae.AAC.1